MILPDLSILIHAHNLDSSRHEAARSWWDSVLTEIEIVALAWVTVLGFVRLTTNRSVLAHPWSVDDALERVEAWRKRPNFRMVNPTERHAKLVAGFLRGAGTAGNLTTDAHLAALAVEHGCTLYSTDTDFARFPGVRWRNPVR